MFAHSCKFNGDHHDLVAHSQAIGATASSGFGTTGLPALTGVEYSEEDGFLFGRRFYQYWSGLLWRPLWVFVPGKYRVYAYWNGQKIAEVSYEAKPIDEAVTIQGQVMDPNGQPAGGLLLFA